MNINETPPLVTPQSPEPKDPALTSEGLPETAKVIVLQEHREKLEKQRASRGGRGTQAEGPIVGEAIKDTPNGTVARLRKVEDRLTEITLEGGVRSPANKEEITELRLELASLKKKLEDKSPRETAKIIPEKPLSSAYEAAIKRFSEKETVEETVQESNLEEKVAEVPESRTEASEMTAEEKEAQIQEILADMTNGVHKRAEAAGATDFVRNVGESWRTVPSKYKYMISAGLILSGMGFAAIGATAGVAAVAGLGTGMRMLGGAAMFAGFEKFFNDKGAAKKRARLEKTGFPFTDDEANLDVHIKANNTMLAGGLAIIIALALPEILREHIQGAETVIVNGLSGTETVETSGIAPVAPEVADVHIGTPLLHAGLHDISHEKLTELTTIKAGEGIWNPVHNQLAFAHPDWSPAELNAETHKLLIENKIVNMDGTELRVHPGAHIMVHEDGLITHDGGIYDYKAPAVEAPIAPNAPSEIVSATTPEMFAGQAEGVVRNYVNNTFGNKGFFGFGATSPDNIEKITAWSDPEVGFAHHTIADLNNAENSPMPIDPHRDFGINNEALRERMKNSIMQFANETGVKPYPGEKIGDYLQRAVTEDLMRGAQK